MTIKLTLPVVLTSIMFGAALAPAGLAAAAETQSRIAEMVAHAKSSADQQELVRWYERREDEVRKQADLYRKLALEYRDYRSAEMPAACEEIARYYDNIARQFELLAEEHRHLAAQAP